MKALPADVGGVTYCCVSSDVQSKWRNLVVGEIDLRPINLLGATEAHQKLQIWCTKA